MGADGEQNEDAKKYVWVFNSSNNLVSKREVQLADSYGETVTVTKGIKAGESVVTVGVEQLKDGAKVQVWKSQKTAQ